MVTSFRLPLSNQFLLLEGNLRLVLLKPTKLCARVEWFVGVRKDPKTCSEGANVVRWSIMQLVHKVWFVVPLEILQKLNNYSCGTNWSRDCPLRQRVYHRRLVQAKLRIVHQHESFVAVLEEGSPLVRPLPNLVGPRLDKVDSDMVSQHYRCHILCYFCCPADYSCW